MSRADVNALTVFFVVVLTAVLLLFINVHSHEQRLDRLEQSPKVVTEVTR